MEDLIIKGNEIKEKGFWGKTRYVIKNNEIKEPGLFGKTVYVINGNKICKPGFLGETVYVIDGNVIKKPGVFGGSFLGEEVGRVKKDGTIKTYLNDNDSNKQINNNDSFVTTHATNYTCTCVEVENEIKEIKTYVHNGIVYHTICKTENGYTMVYDTPEYNKTLIYYTFLNKYTVIKSPNVLSKNDYAQWAFSKLGVDNVNDIHKKLFDEGFYEPSSCYDILSKYNVGDIKNIINKLGLNLKGKKQDLIDALTQQVENSTLYELLDKDYYSITSYGKSWMNDHEIEFKWYNEQEEFETLEKYKEFLNN